jgi:hypothetical protein
MNERLSTNFAPRLPQHAFLAFLFALSFSQVNRPDVKQIGFVLEMQGDWLINGSPIRNAGESVPADGAITLSPQTDFRSAQKQKITIVLLNNEIKGGECSSFTECKKLQPIRLPTSLTPPSSVLKRMKQAVAYLLSLDPERYASAISRGAGAPNKLHDAVLLINQRQISIADWFREVEPGYYALTFVDIGRGGQSRAPVTLNLNWSGGTPASIAAKDLGAGLYAVRVFPADSRANQPISQDAWVLLSSDDQFDKNSGIYHENVELTRQWQNVDAGAVQTFLRACLDQLAAPVLIDGTDK